MDIKEIEITEHQRMIARELYPFNSLPGSVTKGESQMYGALGEIIVHDYYVQKGFDVSPDNTYDYDLLMQGYKVDVKTKKVRTRPQAHHFASIPAWNTRQKCDIYMFARILEDMSKGWILGYKTKHSFYKEATFNKEGDKDWNGWTFKTDCYNLRIDKLNTLK
jgi:hypothetical protein